MVVMSGGGIPDINSLDGGAQGYQDRGGRLKLKYDGKLTKIPPNVLEVPNPDRMKFFERMKREAEQEENEKNNLEINEDHRRALQNHNHEDNDIPPRTKLKNKTTGPVNPNLKATNKSVLHYKAEEVVFHPIPPDNPNGPGLYIFFNISFLSFFLWGRIVLGLCVTL